MSDENYAPKPRCQSDVHSDHLCILTDQYFHVHEAEKYRAMVSDPEFKCQFCGRTAKNNESLCSPVDL